MRKRAAIIVAIIVLASILAGCGGAAAPKEVKIGLIAPMSGGSAGMGINIQRGVTMAAEEINEKGGVKGMKLQIITEDDESNPVKAVNAIKKLIFNDKAPVVIGSNASSCTLAAMDEAAKAKVPLVTPTSSADNITQRDNKYIFRVTASNTTQANDLAAQLPHEMAEFIRRRRAGVQKMDYDTYISRIQGDLDLMEAHQAERVAKGVLSVVRDAVGEGEWQDVVSQMPMDMKDMFVTV